MPAIHQLAAIMFTDIVGYTSLMGDDKHKALSILDKNRELHKPIITAYHGRLIKELGDGMMASFLSVSDAVHAAIKIQEQCNALNDFQLRIGIHLGEVVFENDDAFGDGVNIASRIQTAAKPGSIFISGKVYDDVKNQKDIQTISVGRKLLKNVRDEIEIYAISNPGIVVPEIAAPELTGEKHLQKCILVLPFLNMSNEADQDFFSDGLTEELISSLSRLKDMKVISRTTSMQYKNTNKDLQKIRKETGADYIMEGSVRKHGNNLRITAQFIDAAPDIHIWADSYQGTIDDIFDIQEKVSVKIVDALRLRLTRDEENTLRKRYTINTEAYQLYMKGRHFWKKRNEEGLNTAIRFFEKAIDLDKNYALAWAGMADAYSLMGEFSNISRRELLPKMQAAIDKALQLDNNLAEAHISLATSLMLNNWDWVNAEKEFLLGIKLDPNYATGHHWYAEFLLFTGRITEAFLEISLAVELDPISEGILKDKGIFYYYNRQYDEAISMARQALEMESSFVPSHRLLSMAYAGKGMFDKAIEENLLWGKLTGNKVKTDVAMAQIYADAGRKQDAEKIIHEIEAGMRLTGNDYRGMALIYASLHEKDKAFEWLDKSLLKHEESLCSLKIDPKWDKIRDDERFKVLLKKVGLNGIMPEAKLHPSEM